VTIATWRRLEIIGSVVVLAVWTIWIVQMIRGVSSTAGPWLGVLLGSNIVVALVRFSADRLERKS
jgi:hypothetical protein